MMNRLRDKARHLGVRVTAIMSILLIHKQTPRHDQIQLVFRPRHGDMEQSEFFFNLVRGPGRLGPGDAALHNIQNAHDFPFPTLGRMDCR